MRVLKVKLLLVCALMLLPAAAYAQAPPSSTQATMSNPYWNIGLDSGGFSDAWFWGPSPGHPYMYHELLWGEWIGAIYYDGIANSGADPTAPPGTTTWFTDWFIYPNWTTNSAFLEVVPISTWDNAANPVVGNDTGLAIISNGQVTV